MIDLPLALGEIHDLFYAFPLIVAVSLVYAATRHEYMGPILFRGLRVGALITGAMAVILGLLLLLGKLT